MRLLFNRVLFIAAIVVCMTEAQPAQSRPDTTRMACAAARALVAKQGGVVLGTGPSLYDRYVNSRAHCLSGQIMEPAFVPTADDRQCSIGYTCREMYGDR